MTNDGIVPDGVEQPGWPMPFADIGAETTDTGGNFANSGTVTTDFFGPYVNINDQCGTSSLTGSDVLDWGTSGGTDCATPGFGGAGNTHASRTGFYELNKIIEMARGQLPANSWLQSRLTSNMNINNTCNAFWNGTVNFYRSGGGCFNTGEIAGVFDHEWGHGMDANDATPGIASPSGEGIADIYTALRLNTSCIGRNFRATVCTGFGDPCLTAPACATSTTCKRQSGQPHDYTWSNANCGGSVHCVGGVYSEAVWSLWKRKLQQVALQLRQQHRPRDRQPADLHRRRRHRHLVLGRAAERRLRRHQRLHELPRRRRRQRQPERRHAAHGRRSSTPSTTRRSPAPRRRSRTPAAPTTRRRRRW